MDSLILIVAFGLAFTLHFGVQKLFIYYKRFDDFNHRSSHKTLATRTGGIGIFLTILIVAVYHYFLKIELFDYTLFIPLGIMFVIGVYDDLYDADFKLKFFLQIIVAKILIDQGFVISNYYGLFGLYEVPWVIAQLSTIFVFLVVVNAINFIDGIDGLAITEVIKIILLIEFFSDELTALAPLGLLTLVSILPLYYYNFKKRGKVFLGDGGSMLLGTVIMIYILYILGPRYSFKLGYASNKTLFSVLLLIYPLFDLMRVFILRIRSGTSPFVADKRHLHHVILKKQGHPLRVFAILILSLLITYLGITL
jgi:UDP-N-acetylmuramyl pentapeptide phosphotransferase/UDP-N-acetylglucosamine-1-phosphate transferase